MSRFVGVDLLEQLLLRRPAAASSPHRLRRRHLAEDDESVLGGNDALVKAAEETEQREGSDCYCGEGECQIADRPKVSLPQRWQCIV